MFPPCFSCLPEYHRWMSLPFLLSLLGDAVGGDQGTVEDDVTKTGMPGSVKGLVQVGGLGGQDLDALVEVPVSRGGRDVGVAGELADTGAVTEPAQDQHCLVEASQPLTPRGVPRLRRSA